MSELWTYLTESAGWALLGFVVGFLLGRTVRDVHHIATAVTPETPVPVRSPSRRRTPTGQFVLGVVVVLLGIVTVVQGIITGRATQELTRCQSAYSNAFADALDARTASTAETQQALDQLMRSISSYLENPADPSVQVRAAIGDYLDKRATADAERRQNPYPPPPRDLCG